MKKFNAATLEPVGPSVLMTPTGDPLERRYPAYIGLDVHRVLRDNVMFHE